MDSPEYIGSCTLMILGDDLDPDLVTRSLGLQPDQAWRHGEQKRFEREGKTVTFDSYYEWGGWKRFIEAEHKNACLPEQIAYWIERLLPRQNDLAKLRTMGYYLSLDCFVTPYGETGGTASIILEPELIGLIADMGFELRLSFSS